jgi:hypothetical protein
MSILAEWGDGTTNLIFHIAILLTGLAFEIMGFRLVASGFRAPRSTVLFQWREKKFQMTQAVPGIAIAFIGGGMVIAGFYLIHPHEKASENGDIREGDILEVECSYWPGGGLGIDEWMLTVYGNGQGLLKVEEPHERSVRFRMPTTIRDLFGALARCDVRHLPSHFGVMLSEGQAVRSIKIRTNTFEKLIEIHEQVDEGEEKARCVMGVWKRAMRILEEAKKIREPQEPGKSQHVENWP